MLDLGSHLGFGPVALPVLIGQWAITMAFTLGEVPIIRYKLAQDLSPPAAGKCPTPAGRRPSHPSLVEQLPVELKDLTRETLQCECLHRPRPSRPSHRAPGFRVRKETAQRLCQGVYVP